MVGISAAGVVNRHRIGASHALQSPASELDKALGNRCVHAGRWSGLNAVDSASSRRSMASDGSRGLQSVSSNTNPCCIVIPTRAAGVAYSICTAAPPGPSPDRCQYRPDTTNGSWSHLNLYLVDSHFLSMASPATHQYIGTAVHDYVCTLGIVPPGCRPFATVAPGGLVNRPLCRWQR